MQSKEDIMNYEEVKSNYESGLWEIILVRIAVKKGIITKEQFKEITGENY